MDPVGSRDLDQAICLHRRQAGYRVHYAIADGSAFVLPGGELEAETWRCGQTIYLPDGKVPLHPFSLSEGAGSLLPGETRPAALWTIDLNAHGDTVAVRLERALPRAAINLPIREQEVEPHGDGRWRLKLRDSVPAEEWKRPDLAADRHGSRTPMSQHRKPCSTSTGRAQRGTDGRHDPPARSALDDPPVRARCEGALRLGERIPARLVKADPLHRIVAFEAVARP